METLQCITTRRSIRKFKDIQVEWYKVGEVLYAGFSAPTAGNLQDFRFMVVTEPELKNQLAQAALDQLWVAQAPVIIVVFSEYTKTRRYYGIRGERLYTIQGCAAATQNMLLAAHDLGLGACWVGAFDEDRVRAILGIPDYARPQAMIPLGYPNEEAPTPAKFKLENLVFFNRWGDNAAKVWNIRTEVMKEWSPHVEKLINRARSAMHNPGEALGNKITRKAKELHEKVKQKLNK